MATRRLTRKEQIQQTILYPVDWIEERSGLVGGIKYFLFRKVPGDTNWFQTLGSLIVVCAGTGIAVQLGRRKIARQLAILEQENAVERERALFDPA